MIFDIDNWQEIVSTLQKNRLRSFLTAFGVFWGIFMLIIMLGSGRGLENGVVDNFSGVATNSLFLWPQTTTKPYKGFSVGRRFPFTFGDFEGLRRHLPEIEYLAPRLRFQAGNEGDNVIRGEKSGTYSIYGDYPEIRYIALMDITRGRFLNLLDIREKRKVAVIGSRIYDELFQPDENPIGEYLAVNGVFFKIVGVYESRDKSSDNENRSKNIFIPLPTFQQAYNRGDRVGWFSITTKPEYSAAETLDKVIAFLAQRHQIAPDDKRAFGYWNMEKEFLKIKRLFLGINFLIWFVGIFTLVAGVIGVGNIMLIIVKERTKEIGIKRAIGASPLVIVSQIIFETILLTSVSGYVGLVFGVAIVEGVSQVLKQVGFESKMFGNPEVDFTIALWAILVLVVSGALASLIPAHRAISVKPVDAIRNE